jgi:hypothetical protein
MPDSNATHVRVINVDLPDFPAGEVKFILRSFFAAAGTEGFPQKEYVLTLDGNGVGAQELPVPDNTGAAAWKWLILLPDERQYLATLGYGAALALTAWLAADVAEPSEDTFADLYLPLAGGTLTGDLILAGDPTAALEAATKQYVDNAATGVDALDDVGDVAITAPGDNEVLAYDSASGDWVNQTAAEAGLAAASHNHDASYAAIGHDHDADYAALAHSHAVDDLSDATITGPVADNEVLAWNGSNAWINQTAAEAGLAAASHSHDASYAPAVHTHTESDITDLSDYAEADHDHAGTYAPAAHTHGLADVTDAGTAAALDVPASGNAAVGEVVKGDDTRLTDARTPAAHAATHVNGTDDIQSATAAQKGLMTAAYAGKLDGIEAGATGDQTAADIRTLGFFDITNDGTGSGLDADTVDGSHAAAFATSGHNHDASYAAAAHTHVEANITDLDHTDDAAIHDNVSGEIAALTEKAAPVAADLLLIEDSAASNAKKKVQLGNLPKGAGEVYIPASALWPSTTAGCADAAKTEYGTNDVDLYLLAFDAATQEHAQFGFRMPSDWNGGTITFSAEWTAASGSGDVIWGLQGRAYDNDDALDAAWGTAQEVTDTLTATGDLCITGTSAAITLAGAPAAGQRVQLRVYRKAADAGDTLAADALLAGLLVTYGRS